jgi:glutamate synthase (NADPH) large chain
VGDHGCEYMTGGTVVVLGETGRNFAGGMSGGVAFVWDPKNEFAKRCNLAMVALEPVLSASEQEANDGKAVFHTVVRSQQAEADDLILKRAVESHFRYTGSFRARALLEDWNSTRKQFVKVMPTEYRRALKEMHEASQKAGGAAGKTTAVAG